MSLGRPAMRAAEERGVRRNLEAHAARMKELIAGGMEPAAASSQALKDILKSQPKADPSYRPCTCANCGWTGSRIKRPRSKPCPKCHQDAVSLDEV